MLKINETNLPEDIKLEINENDADYKLKFSKQWRKGEWIEIIAYLEVYSNDLYGPFTIDERDIINGTVTYSSFQRESAKSASRLVDKLSPSWENKLRTLIYVFYVYIFYYIIKKSIQGISDLRIRHGWKGAILGFLGTFISSFLMFSPLLWIMEI